VSVNSTIHNRFSREHALTNRQSLLEDERDRAVEGLEGGIFVQLDHVLDGVEAQDGPDRRHGRVGDPARPPVRLGSPGALLLIEGHEGDGRRRDEGDDSQDDERDPPVAVQRIREAADSSGQELDPLPELAPDPPPELVGVRSDLSCYSADVVHVEKSQILAEEGLEPLYNMRVEGKAGIQD